MGYWIIQGITVYMTLNMYKNIQQIQCKDNFGVSVMCLYIQNQLYSVL